MKETEKRTLFRGQKLGSASLTKSLEGVGHRLVLHHVDESSAETEVWKDEQNILQDVVDASDLLQRR